MEAEAVALRIVVNVNIKKQLSEANQEQNPASPSTKSDTQDTYKLNNILHRHVILAVRHYKSCANK